VGVGEEEFDFQNKTTLMENIAMTSKKDTSHVT